MSKIKGVEEFWTQIDKEGRWALENLIIFLDVICVSSLKSSINYLLYSYFCPKYRPVTLLTKIIQQKCFSVNFTNFSRTPYFTNFSRTPGDYSCNFNSFRISCFSLYLETSTRSVL